MKLLSGCKGDHRSTCQAFSGRNSNFWDRIKGNFQDYFPKCQKNLFSYLPNSTIDDLIEYRRYVINYTQITYTKCSELKFYLPILF